MLIEFSDPIISLPLVDYMNLVDIWKKADPCASFCIRLGCMFFTEGITLVDDEITPLLLDSPRIFQRTLFYISLLPRYRTTVCTL